MSSVGKKGAKADGVRRDSRPEVILGSDSFEQMNPLVQWSPDGVYWVERQSGDDPSGSLNSSMSALVV